MKNRDLNNFLHTALDKVYTTVHETYKHQGINKTLSEVKTEVINELVTVVREDFEGLKK